MPIYPDNIRKFIYMLKMYISIDDNWTIIHLVELTAWCCFFTHIAVAKLIVNLDEFNVFLVSSLFYYCSPLFKGKKKNLSIETSKETIWMQNLYISIYVFPFDYTNFSSESRNKHKNKNKLVFLHFHLGGNKWKNQCK